MKKTIAVVASIATPFVMFFFGCSVDKTVSTSVPLRGNCVGTIRDAGGALVVGACVLLVPESYARQMTGSASDSGLDSTLTNDNGSYGFSVDAPGRYNVLAKKNNLFSIHQAVPISSHAGVELGDTLREAGSISGTIHLQGMCDHRSAIVLLIGTNFYTTPSDTSGDFSIPELAQGAYTLRILTTEPDFAVKETTVSIVSGAHTQLPAIELAKTTVSMTDSLLTDFNPAMMMVTLRWKPADTALISGFSIYCNRAKNLSSVLKVDKSCSSHTFDLAVSPSDTFTYQVAAIGKNGIEGPALTGETFVRTSNLILTKTIRYEAPDLQISPYSLYVDCRENICLVGEKEIIKLDSTGATAAQYRIADSSSYSFNTGIQGDDSGNLYIMIKSGNPDFVNLKTDASLICLDKDLRKRAELPLQSPSSTSFAVSGPGSVMVLERSSGSQAKTVMSVYDSNLTRIHVADAQDGRSHIYLSVNFGDTLLTLENIGDAGWWAPPQNIYRLVYGDNSFAIKSSINDFGYLNAYAPPDFSFDDFAVLGPKGLVGAYIRLRTSFDDRFHNEDEYNEYIAENSLLVLFTGKKVLCRVPTTLFDNEYFRTMAFDKSGNLYVCEEAGLVIYKYSTELLFKGN